MKKVLYVFLLALLAGCLSDPAPVTETTVMSVTPEMLDSLRAVGPDTVILDQDTLFHQDTLLVFRQDSVVTTVYDTMTMVFRDTVVVATDTVTIITRDTVVQKDTIVTGGAAGSGYYDLGGRKVSNLDMVGNDAVYILGLSGPIEDWERLWDMPNLKHLEFVKYAGLDNTYYSSLPPATILMMHGGIQSITLKDNPAQTSYYSTGDPTLLYLQSLAGLGLACFDVPRGTSNQSWANAFLGVVATGGTFITQTYEWEEGPLNLTAIASSINYVWYGKDNIYNHECY